MKAVLVAAVALCAALAGCGDDVTFRYKLGLEVEVDGETQRGFTVVELTYPYVDNVASSARVTGESLALELGPRRLLVALLGRMPARSVWQYNRTSWWGEHGPTLDLMARAYGVPPQQKRSAWLREVARQRGARDLPLNSLPDLFTFDDAANPATVREVDAENLAGTFGSGVRLARATIEITTEPVTTGIESKLSWIRATPSDGMLGGRRGALSSNALANDLNDGKFRRKGW